MYSIKLSSASEYRIVGLAIGCLLALVVPAFLLAPSLFGGIAFAALPMWALVVTGLSATLGAWHIAAAALALDEDLHFITSYAAAQDAAPLVLPFVLFVGTRSVYRRLFTPALVARRRWETRRNSRLQEAAASQAAVQSHSFPNTMPREN